jgi:predicted HTH transcriptional regulator
MQETLESLIRFREELERERDAILEGIDHVESVIALIRARRSAAPTTFRDEGRQEAAAERNIREAPMLVGASSPSIGADDLTEAMTIDAITEAGEKGVTPQELRDQLGLEQPRLKVLIAKLLAAGKIRRVGRTGRAVKYQLPTLGVRPNGSE